MPTTSNRGYASPSHGGSVDTWDTDLNAIFNQVDQNLGAVSSVALSNSNVVLISSQYVCGTIIFSGTLTANVQVTFPNVSAWWTVANLCTGNFSVTVTSGGSILGLPPGEFVDVLAQSGVGMRYRNLSHPIGGYWDYGGSAVPSWVTSCSAPPYLLCDGSTYSSGTYPFLFAILGTTTLPDARGGTRFALNGGTGRLTTVGGIDGNTRFARGGTGTGLSILQANLPNVNLTSSAQNVDVKYNASSFDIPGAGGTNVVTGIAAGGANTQAFSVGGQTVPLGGSGTLLASAPPGYVGGITMIRAA